MHDEHGVNQEEIENVTMIRCSSITTCSVIRKHRAGFQYSTWHITVTLVFHSVRNN